MTFITLLPHDLISIMMNYLPNSDVFSTRVCCKVLHHISSSDSVWAIRYVTMIEHRKTVFAHSLYHHIGEIEDSQSYLLRYKHCSDLDKSLPLTLKEVKPSLSVNSGDGINCLSILGEENDRIAAGTFGSFSVKVFDLRTQNSGQTFILYDYRVHNGSVWKVLNFDNHILSASFDCTLAMVDLSDGHHQLVSRYLGHEDRVLALCKQSVSPNIFVSGSRDRTVRIWDSRVSSSVGCIEAETACVYAVDCHSNMIVAACHGGAVKLYDMRSISAPTGRHQADRPSKSKILESKLSLHPLFSVHVVESPGNGLVIAAGSTIGEAFVCNVQHNYLQSLARYHPVSDAPENDVRAIQFAGGGRYLITCGNSGHVNLHDLSNVQRYLRSSYERGPEDLPGMEGVPRNMPVIARRKISLQQLTSIVCANNKIWCAGMEGKIRSWTVDRRYC